MIKVEKYVAGFLIPSISRDKNAKVRTIRDVGGGDTNAASAEEAAPAGPLVDHSRWDFVLKQLVSETTINGISTTALAYGSLIDTSSETAVAMEDYLQVLATCDLNAVKTDDTEYAALLINAYNVFAVKLLVDHMRAKGPDSLTSINNLTTKGFFSGQKVWKMRAGVIGGRTFTLDAIEHEHLRREWAEPCFHACIVCASLSCPDLRAEAYMASDLRAQLDDQMSRYLSNPTKGLKVVPAAEGGGGGGGGSGGGSGGGGGGTVCISRIFLWFEGDFLASAGSLQDYVSRYVDVEKAQQIAATATEKGKVKWSYFVYNWNINRSS